jgi:hypothetical protein
MVEEFTRAFDRLALIEKDLFLSICPATLAEAERRFDAAGGAGRYVRSAACMKQLGLSGGISLGTAGSSTACGQQHGLETMAAADSGLVRVAALYNIKKEPGQEPIAANSHDEQHVDAKDSDQAVADLAALAAPVWPVAAAAAALQQGGAVPKRVRPVPGNDQAVDHEVESSEGEDREPVSKRRKKGVTTSEYVGVSWNKKRRKWKAQISHDGKNQYLGSYDDEREAARAVDTAARQLRGEDAHGGRFGMGHWYRLNFPTDAEV